MFKDSYYIAALITSGLCLGIIAIAIIRLGLCKGRTRPRLKYTALMLAAFIAACQPYLNASLPGIGLLALSVCVLILLLDGVPALRKYKDENQFFDTQVYDPHWHGAE